MDVAATVHPHGDEDVYRKTDDGNGEHADGGDFRRMQQAADGFDDNPEDDGGERQAVQGGGDDFTATVAEGVFERGRALAPVKGGEREGEGNGVGKHMPGVGKEGEAVGEQAADDFDQHEGGDKQQGALEDGFVMAVDVGHGALRQDLP